MKRLLTLSCLLLALSFSTAEAQKIRVNGQVVDATRESTSTLTGNQDAIVATSTLVRLNNATLLTIRGIAPGLPGQTVTFVSIGAGQVNFAHQSGSVTNAAARLINYVTSGVTPLAAGSGTATFRYDATSQRWRMTAHEQGAYITPAFAAGDYTGNNSMTVTVAAGDVSFRLYRVSGRTVTEFIRIVTTTVGGTPSTLIQVAYPNGYTLGTSGNQGWSRTVDNNGASVASRVTAGATALLFSNGLAGANWTASTDLTQFETTHTYEVD